MDIKRMTVVNTASSSAESTSSPRDVSKNNTAASLSVDVDMMVQQRAGNVQSSISTLTPNMPQRSTEQQNEYENNRIKFSAFIQSKLGEKMSDHLDAYNSFMKSKTAASIIGPRPFLPYEKPSLNTQKETLKWVSQIARISSSKGTGNAHAGLLQVLEDMKSISGDIDWNGPGWV